MTDGTNPVIAHEFERETLKANIKGILSRYRDAHPDTMLEKIMAVVPVRARAAPPANPVIVERVKIAFAASLMNANAGMRWLDHDSMDEMIEAAWEGAKEPIQAALEAMPDVVGLREALDAKIVQHRQTMNNPENEPALRYMASGAFEALRELRATLAPPALAKVSGVSNPLPDSPPRS